MILKTKKIKKVQKQIIMSSNISCNHVFLSRWMPSKWVIQPSDLCRRKIQHSPFWNIQHYSIALCLLPFHRILFIFLVLHAADPHKIQNEPASGRDAPAHVYFSALTSLASDEIKTTLFLSAHLAWDFVLSFGYHNGGYVTQIARDVMTEHRGHENGGKDFLRRLFEVGGGGYNLASPG